MTAGEILRQVIPPLATLWAVVVLMLWAVVRQRRAGRDRDWPPAARASVTVVAGFAFFLAIVWVFETLATGDETALPSALRGGGALLGIALAGFAVLTAVERLLRR